MAKMQVTDMAIGKDQEL